MSLEAVDAVDRQHRERARTLSELVTKLLMRRKGVLPKTFDEYTQDLDIIKRAAEHVGACQAMNEIRILINPDKPLEPAPFFPKTSS